MFIITRRWGICFDIARSKFQVIIIFMRWCENTWGQSVGETYLIAFSILPPISPPCHFKISKEGLRENIGRNKHSGDWLGSFERCRRWEELDFSKIITLHHFRMEKSYICILINFISRTSIKFVTFGKGLLNLFQNWKRNEYSTKYPSLFRCMK